MLIYENISNLYISKNIVRYFHAFTNFIIYNLMGAVNYACSHRFIHSMRHAQRYSYNLNYVALMNVSLAYIVVELSIRQVNVAK